ncbi:hypothetical protein Pmani_007989 [Petrolisthes manimaculis]|uniref:Uncharacterized protein n=1 Tax=Petrolisthes manimaculis TaxID=1843537 RepID=A0AAE1UK54_9EUCA|nr:hypothetical protein Pmani_007988 [Petrolisthes manimaculis]KAK4321184.1 hypothetical protein Pmani_007989 [Petrolisthes manimaculis]
MEQKVDCLRHDEDQYMATRLFKFTSMPIQKSLLYFCKNYLVFTNDPEDRILHRVFLKNYRDFCFHWDVSEESSILIGRFLRFVGVKGRRLGKKSGHFYTYDGVRWTYPHLIVTHTLVSDHETNWMDVQEPWNQSGAISGGPEKWDPPKYVPDEAPEETPTAVQMAPLKVTAANGLELMVTFGNLETTAAQVTNIGNEQVEPPVGPGDGCETQDVEKLPDMVDIFSDDTGLHKCLKEAEDSGSDSWLEDSDDDSDGGLQKLLEEAGIGIDIDAGKEDKDKDDGDSWLETSDDDSDGGLQKLLEEAGIGIEINAGKEDKDKESDGDSWLETSDDDNDGGLQKLLEEAGKEIEINAGKEDKDKESDGDSWLETSDDDDSWLDTSDDDSDGGLQKLLEEDEEGIEINGCKEDKDKEDDDNIKNEETEMDTTTTQPRTILKITRTKDGKFKTKVNNSSRPRIAMKLVRMREEDTEDMYPTFKKWRVDEYLCNPDGG